MGETNHVMQVEKLETFEEIEHLYNWLVPKPESIFEDFIYKKCLYNHDALAPAGAYAVYDKHDTPEGVFPFWTWKDIQENFGSNWCMDQHIRATPEAFDCFHQYIAKKKIRYQIPYLLEDELQRFGNNFSIIVRGGYPEDPDEVRWGAFLDLREYLDCEDYFQHFSGKTRNTLLRQIRRLSVIHSWHTGFSNVIYEFEHSLAWVAETMERKYAVGSYWKLEPKKRSFVKAMIKQGQNVHCMLVSIKNELAAVWLTSLDPFNNTMIYWYGATNRTDNLGKYCYLEMVRKAYELKCDGINGLYGYYPIKQLFGFKPYGLYLVEL